MDDKLKRRVREELIEVGMSLYGLLKHESRTLHRIIHQDEHIKAAVYGRSEKWDGVMLIATDKRVIYYDRKPTLAVEDEISYDMVGGVTYGQVGMWATVVLHTRLGDYKIRYANPRCALKFAEHIEARRIKQTDEMTTIRQKASIQKKEYTAPLDSLLSSPAAEIFLKSRDSGVLSTIDKKGAVHGSAVYYLPHGENIYIITKSQTQKAADIIANKQVALTVYDAEELQTVQLQGLASLEPDESVKQDIINRLLKPKIQKPAKKQPPITKMDKGSYVVIRIAPIQVRFFDYKLKGMNRF